VDCSNGNVGIVTSKEASYSSNDYGEIKLRKQIVHTIVMVGDSGGGSAGVPPFFVTCLHC
jgi:hypothetical protein